MLPFVVIGALASVAGYAIARLIPFPTFGAVMAGVGGAVIAVVGSAYYEERPVGLLFGIVFGTFIAVRSARSGRQSVFDDYGKAANARAEDKQRQISGKTCCICSVAIEDHGQAMRCPVCQQALHTSCRRIGDPAGTVCRSCGGPRVQTSNR